MNGYRLCPVSRDPARERVRRLSARAENAGYYLVRQSAPPYEWKLLDASDGEPILVAATLDAVERWLNS
ncbi:hypothetical protein [Nocardia wallacei]|uniref:Uncharacterized protein n=1 Tax=Nocardia wallacei TaxID=480035 RepID=A0A7G1KD65_9NOCA|nr:hypothetical protein [Nocardia wallacei]BCK52955.1 hypothetical protein NWFMUON74_07270 [Nocardia wallacei]